MSNQSVKYRKGTNPNQSGFVLIEFVVSVAFMAILGSLVVNMLGLGWELNSRNGAVLEVAVDVSASTTWLLRDIHTATATDVPDGGGSQATAQLTWTDGGGAHVCDYALVSGDLVRTCDSVAITTANNISNLLFQRTGDLVTISFDVTSPERPDVSENVVLSVALGAG